MKRVFQNENEAMDTSIESKSVHKNNRIIKEEKANTYHNDDNISTLVVDNGSRMFKLGFNGSKAQCSVFLSIVERPKYIVWIIVVEKISIY
jgi:hypothetical protein